MLSRKMSSENFMGNVSCIEEMLQNISGVKIRM